MSFNSKLAALATKLVPGNSSKFVTIAGDGSATVTTLPNYALTTSKNLNFLGFVNSGNFTTTSDVTASTVFKFTLVGAGAGGGGSNGSSAVGGGGGAGAAVEIYLSGLAPSTSYPIVIGTPGSGGSSAGGNGGPGSGTSITINGITYTAGGGVAGTGTTTSTVAITSTQGTLSASINSLPSIIYLQANSTGFGQSPLFVGSNGGGLPFGTGGLGGRTGFGASAGIGFGAGGGGAVGPTAGGAGGAPGIIYVEWVI